MRHVQNETTSCKRRQGLVASCNRKSDLVNRLLETHIINNDHSDAGELSDDDESSHNDSDSGASAEEEMTIIRSKANSASQNSNNDENNIIDEKRRSSRTKTRTSFSGMIDIEMAQIGEHEMDLVLLRSMEET